MAVTLSNFIASPGIFITGTDTGVGKTVVSCLLIKMLREQGFTALGMKPIATGCNLQEGQLIHQDVEALIQASSFVAAREYINPYAFLPGISPHLAAAQAQCPIEFLKIKQAYQALSQLADRVIVEGTGGWHTPLTDQTDIANLAIELQLPVVLVVGMRLGCLNHAQLSADAIVASDVPILGWIANQIDPTMQCYAENLASLHRRLALPYLGSVDYLAANFDYAKTY